jgi:hypothetical protein
VIRALEGYRIPPIAAHLGSSYSKQAGQTIGCGPGATEKISMENVSNVNQLESIKSFQSSISKSEKALAQMTQKGADTTLVKKRLKALSIGLAMLENVWHQRPHPYTQEDLAEARNVLTGLFPSLENIYAESKAGSPQRTLLERRMKALELAVQAIDDLS